MDPVAFQIGSLAIRWYGILIGLGVVSGLLLARHEATRRGLDGELVTDAVLFVLPAGFVGARLYYVLFNLEHYVRAPGDIFRIWHGGLAIHGGVLAGIAAAVWFSRRRRLPLLPLLDALSPGLALAQSIGRWGNFINREAYGAPVSEAFLRWFPPFLREGMRIQGQYHHPAFLYESLWNLLLCLFLVWAGRRQSLPAGRILALYLGLYSGGRFLVEGLRMDSLMLGPFRAAQVVSLLGIAAAAALWRHLHRKPGDPGRA